MKNPCVPTNKSIDHFISNVFSFFPVILILLPIALLPACAGKKMSVEEASQVAVSMREKPFVPPPRHIDDILSMLDQPGHFDPEIIVKHKAIAEASPPDTENPVTLAKYYLKRGLSARELGRSKQSLKDIRKALQYSETEDGKKVPGLKHNTYAQILGHLGTVELSFGNFNRATDAHKRALEIYPRSQSYHLLTLHYILTGDLDAAEEVKKKGVRFCNEIISNPNWKEKWKTWRVIHKADMQANILEGKGKYAEAESYRRYILEYMNKPSKQEITIKAFPGSYLHKRCYLIGNLIKQERFVEAELEARETLKESIGLGGMESTMTGEILLLLGEIFLSQGRLNDADEITRAAIRILESSGLSRDSIRMGWAMMLLGSVSVAKLNFTEAMMHFDSARQGMSDNQYFYENYFARSPDVILSLLKTGRTEEAIETISHWYSKYIEIFGKKRYETAQMLGFKGMANAMLGHEKQAIKDFSESVPILLIKIGGESNYLKNLRLKVIIESYLDLLTQIHKSKREKEFGINASAEMFELCEGIHRSIIQYALLASSARAAIVDSQLADLVRREQDTLKQIDAFQGTLSNAIAVPPDQQNPDVLKNLNTTINTLNNARNVLLDEIKKRFPKYSDFTDPQPVKLSEVQKYIDPEEAQIVIYPAANCTYVWAIPHKGEIQFAIVSLNERDLERIIAHLRKALDADPGTFGDIPEFDLALAYNLYDKLMKPVKDGWKDAKDLIVIAPGPLAQLPLSVLPTTSVKLRPEKYELFANYRKVPWLIRKVSIIRQPSVPSFVALRKLLEGDPDRKAFAGFGDPIFNRAQLALVENEKIGRSIDSAGKEKYLHVRGIRITKNGNLDSTQISSSHLGNLNRLPDTAEEIKSIANTVGADPDKDIFLGKSASEKQVKAMDLSNRRVIAFASHALVPGDLDGLDQPAIALSAPAVTGDNEDGLLTMGEVLKLKLNADWVVLSACNTGAADGAGAEAVSGLGRAFFYAGTRAILVSMWPVETTSARKLTTSLFRHQKKDKTLSRARAYQKSMLELIDSLGFIDDATGKVVASYAHPLFWAPFIVVGEGGSTQN